MSADYRSRVRVIFARALGRPPHERASLLDVECGGDEELRREVEALLDEHERATTRSDGAVPALAAPAAGPAAAPQSLPKVCSLCGARYDEHASVCPEDGEVLDEDPEMLVNRTLDGRYRIERVLGAGGFGVVYLARHIHLRDHVAIKVLPKSLTANPEWLRRFQREGRAARAIHHPNAVAVHDLCVASDGVTYMVQEYVRGRTLRAVLLGRGRFTPAEAVALLEPIAGALDEAHANGIVHRDLKPENVMVGERGVVKLLDLGIAKLREIMSADARPTAEITLPGRIMGTPLYMSPEQWGELPPDGNPEVDGRADVYSLGVMVYELVSGSPPFRGKSPPEVRHAHLYADPRPLVEVEGVPEAFAGAVARALAKDRRERQGSAGELIAELRRALEDSGAGEAALPDGASPLFTRVLGWSRAETTTGEPAPKRADTPATVATPAASSAGPREAPAAATAATASARFPRLVAVAAALLVALAAAVYLAVTRPWSPPPHRPAAEALFWYEQGAGALREGLYLKARNALQQAVSADDRFALARARLAEALLELDQTDDALRELGHARSVAPDTSALPREDGLYLRAVNDMVIGNYAGAVDAYAELVAGASADRKPALLVDLGRAQEKAGRLDEAGASYSEAAALDPNYAAPLLRAGVLRGRKDEMREAEEALGRAEALYQRLSNLEGVAEVLLQKGSMYAKASRPADARRALERALDLSRAIGNDSQQVRALFRLSSVAFTDGDAELARRLAEQAVDHAKATGMESLTASGLVELGNAFFQAGQSDEAARYFDEGLDYARRRGARSAEAHALLLRGSLRIQRGDVDTGLEDVNRAMEFFSRGGYGEAENAGLLLIGRAHAAKGEYDAALDAFRRQLRRGEELDNPFYVASARDELGAVLAERERYAEALEHYTAAAGLYEQLGDQQGLAYNRLAAASVEWKLGRYDEALAHLSEVEAVASRPGGIRDLLAWVWRIRAEIALSRGRAAEAAALAERALAAGTPGDDLLAADAKAVQGRAEALSGRAREALRLCREAAEAAGRTEDRALIARTHLALAGALLANGDVEGAQRTADDAREVFEGGDQIDSHFSSLMVLARARQSAGDEAGARETAARAEETLARFERELGPDAFRQYASRPDVALEIEEMRRTLGRP